MDNQNKQLLILIDGNSLINRAFYALPPLNDADGNPTQAVYGFCNMLIKAIEDFKPTHAAVAFDMRAPTFRHKQYEGYKATRKGMPDELACQLPVLKGLLKDMGIATIEKEGFEADDILGTMSDGGMDNIIITGDRDAFQLIDNNTKVAFTKKGISYVELFDTSKFTEEYGFAPLAIIDYKALCGDSSDNIPGVPGVGDKTALLLINKYGSLDGVYGNISEITGKMKEKLIEGKDSAYLSFRLATIDRKVELDVKPQDCVLKFPFGAEVKDKFQKYNFKSLVKREELFIGGKSPQNAQPQNKTPKIENKEISDPFSISLKGDFALAISKNTIIISDQSTQYTLNISDDLLGLSLESVLLALKPYFEDNNIQKVLLDAKTLKHTLNNLNISLNNLFDIKLAQYILDVNIKFDTAAEFCEVFDYPPQFSAYFMLLESKKQKQNLKEQGMEKLYYDLEMPLLDVLYDMENIGFKLDMQLNDQLSRQYAQETDKLTKEIYEQAGISFNINSPKQLGEVLFEKLKIPYPKKSKAISTAFEILDPLQHDYPIVAKVLEYRKITKLSGTYIEGFKKLADSEGVIRTEFKQALTMTGRLSSIEPNLQNIPVREEEGRRLRGLFVAREGKTLITADYSQIELRLLAHFSGDKTMTEAFFKGEDIHTGTAAAIYGVPLQSVTGEMRRAAKAVNFGIVYGISDFGLAANLKIPVYKAHEFIERYFERFYSIKEYLDSCVAAAQKSGMATTLYGRQRRIPELKSPNYQTRKFGERVAMNTPLQGSAADIIKHAMINVYNALKGTDSRLILQVHDELIVEASINEAEKIKDILIDKMENVVRLNVPLSVSAASGKSWIDCK